VDRRLEAARPAVRGHRNLAAEPAVTGSAAHLEDTRYAVAVHTRRFPDLGRRAAAIDQTPREVDGRHGLEAVPRGWSGELRL
jgi:hypothetical protein